MAYFLCTAGGSTKGNSVIVTCDADFAGQTITCTNGVKTYTKVCPLSSPYTVTFTGLAAGTWTISATVDGVTYTTTVIVTDFTADLNYGFSWQRWVDSSSTLHSSDYVDLSALLADEAALRQLFLEHATVDYMASTANVTPDLDTVLNDDYCAKWINLSDYALDMLYANPEIATVMDTADKYGYGEWVITDNTTTPPTWGAKGNVPIMTSNTAPYGEAIRSSIYNNAAQFEAWHAFDGSTATMWAPSVPANQYIVYKSTNPICAKQLKMYSNRILTFQVLGSNDGNTYESIGEFNVSASLVLNTYDLNSDKYYLYHKIVPLTWGETPYGIPIIQFYGRELSVSVPAMTGYTTPYGEASASSYYDSGSTHRYPYQAFNGVETGATSTNAWLPTINTSNNRLTYKFVTPTYIKKARLVISGNTYNNFSATFTIYGSNDGATWSEALATITSEANTSSSNSVYVVDVNADTSYLYYSLFTADVLYSSTKQKDIYTLQFYGKDYSEKEFEVGATKKWLYDHGLELESFVAWGSGAIIRDTYQIGYNKTVSGNNGIITANSIDLTPYNLLRMKVGDTITASNNEVAVTGFTAYVVITANDMPNNVGLNIETVDASKEILATPNTSAATGKFTFKELWLE